MTFKNGLQLGSRAFSSSTLRRHARVREFPKAARKPLLVDPLYASPHTKRFRVTGVEETADSKTSKLTFFVRPPSSLPPPTMAIEFNRENLPTTTESRQGSHPLLNRSNNNSPYFIPNNPLLSYSPTSASDLSSPIRPYAHLAPPLKKEVHDEPLTESIIKEICNLRMSDPHMWTVSKLSRKFKCSPRLIMAAGYGNGESAKNTQISVSEKVAVSLKTVKAGWSRKRTNARTIREARREMW